MTRAERARLRLLCKTLPMGLRASEHPIVVAALSVPALLDALDERDRTIASLDRTLSEGYWECESCHARFPRPGRLGTKQVAPEEGVTHCSRCVEVEILAAQRNERDRVIESLRGDLADLERVLREMDRERGEVVT